MRKGEEKGEEKGKGGVGTNCLSIYSDVLVSGRLYTTTNPCITDVCIYSFSLPPLHSLLTYLHQSIFRITIRKPTDCFDGFIRVFLSQRSSLFDTVTS